jgi:hypothetical protein
MSIVSVVSTIYAEHETAAFYVISLNRLTIYDPQSYHAARTAVHAALSTIFNFIPSPLTGTWCRPLLRFAPQLYHLHVRTGFVIYALVAGDLDLP